MDGVSLPGRTHKRDKVRSAWISFAGRITAQIIGSIATVTLGVVVLGKGHPPAPVADHASAAKPSVLIATPVRTHGETVIVMLPLGNDGQVDQKLATEVAENFEKTKASSRLVAARRQTPIDPPAPQSSGPSDDTREIPVSPHE